MYATLIQPRQKKNIGLTALIDVVFILLLFFMLTTTFNQWEFVDVQSSFGESSDNQPSTFNKLVLREDGAFALLNKIQFVEDIVFIHPSEDLPSHIDKSINTVLIPYQDVKLQQILDFMSYLKNQGVKHINLVQSIESI